MKLEAEELAPRLKAAESALASVAAAQVAAEEEDVAAAATEAGEGNCHCLKDVCPMLKYSMCEYCVDAVPKPRKCAVRACVEARRRAAEGVLLLRGPAETGALTLQGVEVQP